MIRNSIALLGATSHIAKGIIYNFVKDGRANELALFARSAEKVKGFLSEIKCNDAVSVFTFDEFSKGQYSSIINCVGFGNPSKLSSAGNQIFEVTEKFDNLAIEYIKNYPETLYVNFSSGAVYGDFAEPAREDSCLKLFPNKISPDQFYGIAKLYSEVKHRSYSNLKIVDLRIFGYFSRFIDLEAGFLLSDVARCIHNKTALQTTKVDIIRDYVHPEDLYELVHICISQNKINCAIDVMSKQPVSKIELLEVFSRNFQLKYQISDDDSQASPTGIKNNYFSESVTATALGFYPRYSSIDGVIDEMQLF